MLLARRGSNSDKRVWSTSGCGPKAVDWTGLAICSAGADSIFITGQGSSFRRRWLRDQ
jgi:hypothetical protein